MDKRGISAVILAGGGSTRMGQNKALLQLGEKTMIERIIDILRPLFNEIIVVTNLPEEYSFLKDIIFVKDVFILTERNSLVGMYSGLLAAKNPFAFIVPCDMPFLNAELIHYMMNQVVEGEDVKDVLIPFIGGHYQPLHAIYSKNCLKPIRRLLEEKKYKITGFFSEVSVKTVGEDSVRRFSKDLQCFSNINTYEAYLNILQQWDKK